MIKNNFFSEIKVSLKITGYIISSIMFVIIFIAFIFPETLLKLSPVCTSKLLYNQECFMCGTTRAFIEIANGNFSGAFDLNKFSIALFFIFFAFSCLLFFSLIKKLIIQNNLFFITGLNLLKPNSKKLKKL